MAKGDWGPGARLEPLVVNITVDSEGVVMHVGVGYHLRLPSGRAHASGFSWDDHCPDAQPFVDRLLAAAAAHEGVDGPGQMTAVDGSQDR